MSLLKTSQLALGSPATRRIDRPVDWESQHRTLATLSAATAKDNKSQNKHITNRNKSQTESWYIVTNSKHPNNSSQKPNANQTNHVRTHQSEEPLRPCFFFIMPLRQLETWKVPDPHVSDAAHVERMPFWDSCSLGFRRTHAQLILHSEIRTDYNLPLHQQLPNGHDLIIVSDSSR